MHGSQSNYRRAAIPDAGSGAAATRMRRRDKWLVAVAIVLIVGVAIRAALPTIVRDYVNDRLQALQGYEGHIDNIDIAMIRGAYGIDHIKVERTGSGEPVPFFSCDRIDLSVEWRSLLHGSLVAAGEFINPHLNLVAAENKQKSQTGAGVDWAARLAELFPFRFNTVRAHNGTVSFRAPGIKTADAIKATRLEARITNLTNVVDSGKENFADFQVTAQVLDGGTAKITGSVDPTDPQPTFDVNLEVRKVTLPQVNPWLRQYIKAEAAGGDFELYMELAAADGKFQGYAKPMLRNVDIASSEEHEEGLLKRIWEGVVDFAAKVLENDQTKEVAARIPFSGSIKKPQTSIFETTVSVLHNAFVGAFARSLEGSVSVHSVRENLHGVGEPAADTKADDNKQHSPKRKT